LKLKIAYITVLFFSLAIPSAFADTVSTEIDDTSYDIDYNANNVVLKSVTADLDFISLIFETEVSGSEGDVSITFQRDFFDAKLGYSDDDFFILSDGDEIEFEEVKTDEYRTLSFSLSAGTEEIEIIGTILANNSFLIEQEQQDADDAAKAQAEADAQAQAEAAAKAQAEADAQAQAEAAAKAQAEADAKNAEEEKIENMMNTCGDGTVYENGECVLSPMEKNASDFRTGPLIYSIVIGMSLGIVIMMILWGIGKKSHKVLSDDDS
jgi:Membrane protein involved in colicin uptake